MLWVRLWLLPKSIRISFEYAILLPLDEDQVVILELESTDEEQENFVTVDDSAVLEAVFELFKEKYKDEFNFVD